MTKLAPVLSAHWDDKDSFTLEGYKRHGGYTASAKALAMDPDAVIQLVKDSGLRGRGGAGFPTGMKWGFIPQGDNKDHYLVVNADESEPGTCKDTPLLMANPHVLIEGCIIACHAIRAKHAFIYIRGEVTHVVRRVNQAITDAYAAGILGNGIDVVLHIGAGAYICGEETALLDSLEGFRGQPRLRPPFPAIAGLYARPTVVNNVETIAAVVPIVMMGGDEYAKIGIGRSTGTKLISASGHINKPGVYEIELGLPVEEFVYSEEYCGGIWKGKKMKACIPGGSSVPIIPAEMLLKTAAGEPRLMTYESLSDGGFAGGSMLGSGGFMVYDEDTSIPMNLYTLNRFYHHESCGQCSPCREGTGWMEKVAHRLAEGHGKPTDIDLLWDIQKRIEGNTICPLGDAAAWPVASAIRHFRHEFEALIPKKEVAH